MTSRWSKWRSDITEIPSTPYEACVFLDDAVAHLWNQPGDRFAHHDAWIILLHAHQDARDEIGVAA